MSDEVFATYDENFTTYHTVAVVGAKVIKRQDGRLRFNDIEKRSRTGCMWLASSAE